MRFQKGRILEVPADRKLIMIGLVWKKGDSRDRVSLKDMIVVLSHQM